MNFDRDETIPPEKNIAGFCDRVVAFSLDIAVFAMGYFATLRLFFPGYPLFNHPERPFWARLWLGFFLLYQAYFSCEGRRTLGKAMVGLRVVGEEGRPLSLGLGIFRSAAYLLSSLLNLGFLWSLFHPARRCWHDMAVGSFVLEDRPRSALARGLLRAGAFACMALFAGLWYWDAIVAPRYRNTMDVAYANMGLEEMKVLQRLYYRSHGRFADSMAALAEQSGEPQVFMSDMAAFFDARAGVRIMATPTSYKILARATDDDSTLVAFNGP